MISLKTTQHSATRRECADSNSSHIRTVFTDAGRILPAALTPPVPSCWRHSGRRPRGNAGRPRGPECPRDGFRKEPVTPVGPPCLAGGRTQHVPGCWPGPRGRAGADSEREPTSSSWVCRSHLDEAAETQPLHRDGACTVPPATAGPPGLGWHHSRHRFAGAAAVGTPVLQVGARFTQVWLSSLSSTLRHPCYLNVEKDASGPAAGPQSWGRCAPRAGFLTVLQSSALFFWKHNINNLSGKALPPQTTVVGLRSSPGPRAHTGPSPLAQASEPGAGAQGRGVSLT